MSIASEITSIGENLKKDYQSIANLGADLTNVDKNIENIAELLDGVYDNLPKTEYQEGTELNLGVTSKGKLDYENGVVGIGQSSQYSTQGYNLFNPQSTTITSYGITKTKNADGSYTFNGTCQIDTSDYADFHITNANIELLTSTTYKLNIADTFPSGVQYFATCSSGNSYQYPNITTKSGTSVTGISKVNLFFIRVNNGTTLNNLVLKPMVTTDTSKTYDDYEPYTNGASPNPSYPQEIKCVSGKNRFDSEIETGSFTEDGLNTDNPRRIRSKDYIAVAPNTTYTLSVKNNVSQTLNMSASFYTVNDYTTPRIGYVGWGTGEVFTFTTPSNCKFIRILCKYSNEREIGLADITNVQLEQGTQATPYLPYNTIEEVVRGLNLLPWNSHTGKTAIQHVFNPPLKAGTYAISFEAYNPTSGKAMDFYDSNNTNLKNLYIPPHTEKTKQTSVTITSSTDIKTIALYSGSADDVISEIMFVEGTYTSSTIPDYEPYITPTSYQLSLGDIELNAIGDYKDYIYKNLTNNKWYLHKETKKVVFDGTEDGWSYAHVTEGEMFRYTRLLDNKLDGSIVNYCNYYKGISASTIRANNQFYITIASGGYSGFVNFMDDRYTDLDDFKEWVSTHNLIVYYVLATPTDTEITDETLINQLNAWYNAHSNNGTTIITSNGNLPMIIKVRGLKGE